MPSAPSGLGVTARNTGAALAWDAARGSAVTRREYRYRTGPAWPDDWTPIPDSGSGGANARGYWVGGLQNGLTYTFQLRAVNDTGASPPAAEEPSVVPVEPANPTFTPESPPPPAVYSEASYDITLSGDWTEAVTPGGVPSGADVREPERLGARRRPHAGGGGRHRQLRAPVPTAVRAQSSGPSAHHHAVRNRRHRFGHRGRGGLHERGPAGHAAGAG